MAYLSSLIACIFGPRLYAQFTSNNNVSRNLLNASPNSIQSLGSLQHRLYQANQLETFSDYIIRITNFAFHFGLYTSPVLISYFVFRRSLTLSLMMNPQNGLLMIKCASTLFTLLAGAMIMRGVGRYQNEHYKQFLRVLREAHASNNTAGYHLEHLNRYDFDFSSWPITFDYHHDSKLAHEEKTNPPSPYKQSYRHKQIPPSESRSETESLISSQQGESDDGGGILYKIQNWPIELIASVAMHTFGRLMIYPGTVGLVQTIMQSAILAGRSNLIQVHSGRRYKLKSYTGESVDTLFVDQRNSNSTDGNILVIGCEGNAGYYEVGTINTPLLAGFSVLGWNHPGFGGSSGLPWPDNEVAAVDIVVKFAIEHLNFPPERIIMYGWSIGGFTASWAAMRYPKLAGVVLDATFDNLEPLAMAHMPRLIAPITRAAIKKYFDLNNVRHLHKYSGPVLLIRRTNDEIVSIDPANPLASNRANDLLVHLLSHRYPKLINNVRSIQLLREFLNYGDLSGKEAFLRRHSVNPSNCLSQLYDYLNENPLSFPVMIGDNLDDKIKDQLILFLAHRHLQDHESVHTAPLPPNEFRYPFDLFTSVRKSNNPLIKSKI